MVKLLTLRIAVDIRVYMVRIAGYSCFPESAKEMQRNVNRRALMIEKLYET